MRLITSTRGALLALAICGWMFAGAPSASADTIQTFNVAGAFQSGNTISGTLTIDVTTGIATAANLSYSGLPGDVYNGVAGNTIPNFFGFGDTVIFIFDANNNANDFALVIPAINLIGYNGGPLCGVSPLAPNCNFLVGNEQSPSGFDLQAFGTVTPVPEPGSMVLMATGLLGMAGTLRRRIVG